MGSVNLPSVIAAVLGAAGVAEAVARSGGNFAILLQAAVLALCGTVPVAFLFVRRTAAAAVISGSVLLALLLGESPTVATLPALTGALYLVGARGSVRTGLAFALPFAAYAVAPIGSRPGGEVFGAILLGVVAGALLAGGSRQSHSRTAVQEAATGANTDMAYAYAARQERARIARELHDIVAHHISLISVQAETARMTVRDLPPEGAEKLLAIGDTARQALTEMRRVLGVLRGDAEPDAARLPQPGLDELITLVDHAQIAGGPQIRLVVRGPSRRLAPGLELTAYRIVQEALTNARKHAPGAAVDVEVGFHPDRLHLYVWNTWGDGRGEPSEEGLGLLGMRERVALAGGTLRTGRSRTGGFVVEAVLPVNGTP